MLRWMIGVTELDRIRNERIRGTTKVGEISKRREGRLKWYGHVLRREEEYCGQEIDGDGGAGEKKERETEAEVVGLGQHQERLAGLNRGVS